MSVFSFGSAESIILNSKYKFKRPCIVPTTSRAFNY